MIQRFYLDMYLKEMKPPHGRYNYTFLFTSELFTITKTWKQRKRPLRDDKEATVYTHIAILSSQDK